MDSEFMERPDSVVGETWFGKPLSSDHQRPGCYLLRHRGTGKIYVGSSVNVFARVNCHKHCLKRPLASSPEIVNVCRSDQDFLFDITFILTEDAEVALDYEQAYMDKYFDQGILLNRKRYARHKGSLLSDEIKARIKETHVKIPVVVEGVWYPSYMEVSRKYGLFSASVIDRVASPIETWKNWCLADENGKPVLKETRASRKKKPIEIEGVRYASVKDAALARKEATSTIQGRISSTNTLWANWKNIE